MKLDKLGRPNKGWSHIKRMGQIFERQLHLKITDEDYRLLKQKSNGRSLAEQVRTYIEWGLENENDYGKLKITEK